MKWQDIPIHIITWNTLHLTSCHYSLLRRVGIPNPVVVFDNGSTDGTYKWFAQQARRDPRLRIVGAAENIGHGPAMQHCLDLATDEIIAFIDSDTVLVGDDLLRIGHEMLEAHPEAYGVGRVCYPLDRKRFGSILCLSPWNMLVRVGVARQWPRYENRGAPMFDAFHTINNAGLAPQLFLDIEGRYPEEASPDRMRNNIPGMAIHAKQVTARFHGETYPRNAQGAVRPMTRNDFPKLLKQLKLTGVGVEVGVESARYSQVLLKGVPWREFFGIDSYESFGPYYFGKGRDRALRVYGQYENATLLEMDSLQASPRFDDSSIDFVYIDATHEYESVRDDIAAWWPKVKPGGLLAGHDFCEGHPITAGVVRAVREFALASNLHIRTTMQDHVMLSWYIRKPQDDR